jgi:hypothetical protein
MIQTLQSNAFENVIFQNLKILSLQSPLAQDASIVFFTGSNCRHCVTMREVIDRVMPRYMGKMQFFTINLSENKVVVTKSQGTVYAADGSDASIPHVPMVVFYRKMVPIMRFQGEYNEAEFVQFLTKAANIEYMAESAAPPPPVYQPAAAPPQSNPAAYQTYAQQNPQTYAQQPQQQTYYPPPSHFPAQPQSPYQQSYYNTPHYRPPMPEQRLPRQQNFEIADARSGGVFQSVENCSGKKFCYLTLSSAYSSRSN